MDAENDEQAEQCRDKEPDPKEHDRLGHDATLVTLLDSRSGSTSPPCDLESVLSGRAPDGAAVVLPVRPSPFRSSNSPLCLATLTPSETLVQIGLCLIQSHRRALSKCQKCQLPRLPRTRQSHA